MTTLEPTFAKLFYGIRSVDVIDGFSDVSIDTSSESHINLLRDRIVARLTELSGGYEPKDPTIRVWETKRGTKHVTFKGTNSAFEVRFKEC